MTLLFTSFLAGILTVLAPCVLPLLPIIIGSSVSGKNKWKPIIVTLSLAVSITIFTLLLKVSTLLIDIDPKFWTYISGGLVTVFGLIYLFPSAWDSISVRLGLSRKSDTLLEKAGEKEGPWGAVLLGGALGPVFASCSPTYSLIIATILPVNFAQGLIYIIAYALGLAVVMLAVSLLGRKLVKKLNVLADPKGWFKRGLGVLFLIVGISVMTGFDKIVETKILDSGYFDITKVEQNILEKTMDSKDNDKNNTKTTDSSPTTSVSPSSTVLNQPGTAKASEIAGIESWINSNGETIAGLKGKVVLVDFWTYSCINCQRTLPYVTKWYDTYKDQGFVVLGIHAPEFAFEKKKENVEDFVKKNGINYPVGLDNNFATWSAYKNQFWPAQYLIDKDGNVRRIHTGEGQYVEGEEAIRQLLKEKGSATLGEMVTKPQNQEAKLPLTPETYLSYSRGERFANTGEFKPDLSVNFTSLIDSDLQTNSWTFGGSWTIGKEDSVTSGTTSTLKLKYSAKEVYLVMGSVDGSEKIGTVSGDLKSFGSDVDIDGKIRVQGSRLYKVIKNSDYIKDGIFEITLPAGVRVNTFTFG